MFKIFILLFVTTTFALPSTTQVDQVKASLAQLVNSNRQDLVPGFIRLAFHSCIGGCKGCVDVSLQGHAGLASRIAALNSIYTQVSGFMSKADLFALAGQVAIEQGALRAGGQVALPSVFGRTDTTSCANVNFPDDHGNSTAVFAYFAKEFPSLTRTDIVALLGTHGSGRVQRANSGFVFPGPTSAWTPPSFGQVDNVFFQRIQANPWNQVDTGAANGKATHFIWRRNRNNGMLNPDISLVRDFAVDADGRASCTFPNCAHAATLNVVQQFSNNRQVFYSSLAEGYGRMVSNGYASGVLLSATVSTASPTTETPSSTKAPSSSTKTPSPTTNVPSSSTKSPSSTKAAPTRKGPPANKKATPPARHSGPRY